MRTFSESVFCNSLFEKKEKKGKKKTVVVSFEVFLDLYVTLIVTMTTTTIVYTGDFLAMSRERRSLEDVNCTTYIKEEKNI